MVVVMVMVVVVLAVDTVVKYLISNTKILVLEKCSKNLINYFYTLEELKRRFGIFNSKLDT